MIKLLLAIGLSTAVFSYSQEKIEKFQKNVYIQPYGNINKDDVEYLGKHLKKRFEKVYINPTRQFPKSYYVKERNRYRADSIIKNLSKENRLLKQKDRLTIAITDSDISATKGNIKDWGVIGLGYKPGTACVISTFRLKKKNKREQMVKAALHELGHNLGLDHCPTPTCLMRDAKGGNPIDQEKDYCNRCIGILADKYNKTNSK